MTSDKPKKIVFITNLDVLGGSENNLASIVTNSTFNNSCHCIIFSGTPPHRAIKTRLEESNTMIIQYKQLFGFRLPWIVRGRYFKKQIESLTPDTVIFWNHIPKYGQLNACNALKRKTIFFERGIGWGRHDPKTMKDFLDSVDIVLSNSFAGKRMLAEKWGYDGQCGIVPNALRPEINKRQAEPRKLSNNRPLRIGVAARLVAYKGVASVILAAKELINEGLNAELHIAGDGPEGLVLQELCSRLAVPARFLGAVQDMAGFYDSIDLLVCPSIREPFGTVVLEAQARGCPVVCSGVDGLPEIVLHGQTGFIVDPQWDLAEYLKYASSRQGMPDVVYCPGRDRLVPPRAVHPGDVAAAVRQIVHEPEGYLSMSLAARHLVLKNFRFDGYLKSLTDIFHQAQ